MIYLLKFGASFLLLPGIFIVLFAFIAAYLWRRERKAALCMAVGTISFYLLSIPIVSDLLLGSLESRFDPPNQVVGDVIIMLGGGATSDTPDIDGLGNLGGNAANRLLTAARLQRQLDIPIILSGGQVYSDSGKEAIIAKRILIGLGIAKDSIILEDQSLNTKQNVQNTQRILQEKGYNKPILVTSAFHMERSVLNFAKLDIDVLPYPADYIVNRQQDLYFNKFAPSDGALRNSCIFFREWLGIVAARLVK